MDDVAGTRDGESSSLWGHADFLRLWAAQSISVFGSQFTELALPLVAVLSLRASPAEMGVLSAMRVAPFLLFGLIVGVVVDRVRRRPVMIIADVGRAAVLGVVPLGLAAGALGMPHLYAVAFLVGTLTVCFAVAYQAYIPSLVPRSHIVEGNSKLEASRSLAQLSGPTSAGLLIQAMSAAAAIVVDALSFLASAVLLLRIRANEESSPRPKTHLLADVREGLNVVLGHPILRGVAGATATANFFSAVWNALYILYATRELHLTPALIGLVAGAGNVFGVIASVLAARIAARVGVGPAIFWSMVVSCLGGLPIVAATSDTAIVLLALGNVLMNTSTQVYNITQVSLRQSIVPRRLQGRMNATVRFLVWGTTPLGALLGGTLGQWLGIRPAIAVGVVGSFLAIFWIVVSPVPSLARVPETAD